MDVVARILNRLNPKKGYERATEKDEYQRYPLRGFLIDEETGLYYTG
jgi:hypothetical protein